MKIALVPSLIVKSNGLPIPYIPLGLLSIMGCLKNDGMSDVDLIDVNCNLKQKGQYLSTEFYDDTAQSIAGSGYSLVGFSITSSSVHHLVSLAKRIKQINPEVIIIAGGPGTHTPSLAASMLQTFPCIDYLVAGEGESVLPGLVRFLQARKKPLRLSGVFCKDGEKVAKNEPPALITNLDNLPFPDFASLGIRDYIYNYRHSDSIIHLEQGRGCPFRCTYCSTSAFWRRQPRCKSAERVLVEMDLMNRLYSLNSFSLINDCFNSNQQRLVDFCSMMESANRAYTWGCSLRLDLVTPNLLDQIWDAGCRAFFAGVESGSEHIQRLIGKNLNLAQVIRILGYAVHKGFHVRISFIIGFPEETQEDLMQTMQLHKRCLDIGVTESHVNLLTPLHGSRLLESAKYPLEFDGHGSTLSNNLILEEHLPAIRKYPQIFSAFYYFKPRYVSRQEFIEEEILANILANMYPQVPHYAHNV